MKCEENDPGPLVKRRREKQLTREDAKPNAHGQMFARRGQPSIIKESRYFPAGSSQQSVFKPEHQTADSIGLNVQRASLSWRDGEVLAGVRLSADNAANH